MDGGIEDEEEVDDLVVDEEDFVARRVTSDEDLISEDDCFCVCFES